MDTAIEFCLTIKNLFGLALRQATGMVRSLLKLAGREWATLDYTTLCKRQKELKVQISYRPSYAGLHLLVDSTGLKMMGERMVARDVDRQVVELPVLQVCAAILNRFTQLDTPETVRVA